MTLFDMHPSRVSYNDSDLTDQSTLNYDAIQDVMNVLTEENLDMSDWGLKNSCKTTLCLGGHTVVQAGGTIDWEDVLKYDPVVNEHAPSGEYTATQVKFPGGNERFNIEDTATRILGFNASQAHFIFYACNAKLDDLWERIEFITMHNVRRPRP